MGSNRIKRRRTGIGRRYSRSRSDRFRPSIDPLEPRLVLAAPMSVDDTYVTSQGTVLDAGLVNGTFEVGDLTGWETFTTPGGTLGGAGFPDVVAFDVDGDEVETESLQLLVGDGGGGIRQVVQLTGGEARLSVDVAAQAPTANANAGRFELLLDGEVLDWHEFGAIGANAVERATLSATIDHVTPGDHEIRIRVTRERPSSFGVSPFALIDDVRVHTALGSVLANDADADGDPLRTLLTDWPEHGALQFHPDGSFRYQPDAAFVGQDSFSYRTVEPGQGYTLYSIDVDNDKLVKIDSTSGEITIVGSIGHDMGSTDLTYLNGYLYAVTSNREVVIIDPATGEALDVTQIDYLSSRNTLNGVSGITAADGQLYMTFGFCDNNCHAAYMLGRYDPETGELVGLADYRSASGGFNVSFSAVSTDSEGRIVANWLISGNRPAWYWLKFDPDSWTGFGNMAWNDFSLSDMTFVGTSHFMLNPSAEILVRVEPEAGYHHVSEVTTLGALGDSLRGLTFAPDFETQQATVTIDVLPQEVPLARPDAYTLVTGQELQTDSAGGVLANDRDQDGDALTVTLLDDVAHGTLTLGADGAFTYRPDPGFVGIDRFTYVAGDGENDSNPGEVTLFVLTDNEPPVAVDDAYQTGEDQTLTAVFDEGVVANDLDDDLQSLQVVLVDDVRHGQLTLNEDGSFIYVPEQDFHGIDRFTYRADDPDWESNTAMVTITVSPINDAPVAVDDQYTLDEGTILETDPPDEQPVSEMLISQGAVWKYLDDGSDQGTAWREPGFDDASWDEGPAELGYGDRDEATVIGYGGDDNAKYATSYFRHSFEIERLENLVDLTLDVLYDDGVALYLNGVQVLRENLDPAATYDTYAINSAADMTPFRTRFADSDLLVQGTNVLAAEVHQATPTSSDVSFDLRLYATRLPGFADVLDNDRDVEGDALRATLESAPANGQLTLRDDGSFRYVPDEGFYGTDTFSYRAVDDEDAPSEPATVTLVVNKVNVAPAAIADRYMLDGDQPLQIDAADGVLANDDDPDGQPLTATLFTQPSHGAVELDPDGSFVYTPGPSFGLTDTFTYRASDGELESAPVEVTILADVPTIDVGDHQLALDFPGQVIDIMVSGGQPVTGVNIRAQIGDGTGPVIEPRFQAVEFAGGIWDAAPTTTGGGPVAGAEQFLQANTQFNLAGATAPAEGHLVRLVIDTRGVPVGTYDLLLKGTEIGVDSDFVGTPAHIVNGTITVVSPQVVGRHLFYNDSYHDGQDAGVGPADDAAIASDKSALMPGQTATFENYSSYLEGINGLVIDVAGLTGVPTADDFRFRMGNDSNPENWDPAPDPLGVHVRENAGMDGSDRITIIWPDRAIRNGWLQVTMLATSGTNLSEDDVFYFGNAVGEAGDTPNAAFVDGTDFALARDNPRTFLNRAPVDFPYDYNRDSFVDGFDLAVARDNGTNFLTALKLITAPQIDVPPSPGLAPVALPTADSERSDASDQEPDEAAPVARRAVAVDWVIRRGAWEIDRSIEPADDDESRPSAESLLDLIDGLSRFDLGKE